jgi:hypothetical protein
VSAIIIAEIKRMIKESEIMKEDDANWPQKNKDGRQELEIRLGNEHISFEVSSKQPKDALSDAEARRQKSALCKMSQTQPTLKVSASSTTWCKT